MGHDTELFTVQPFPPDLTCGICMNAYDNPVIGCQRGHVYCNDCLDTHIDRHRGRGVGGCNDAVCPSCREPLLGSVEDDADGGILGGGLTRIGGTITMTAATRTKIPNRYLADAVMNMQVRCPSRFASSGGDGMEGEEVQCPWTGTFSSYLSSHKTECDFVMVSCPYCSACVPRKDISYQATSTANGNNNKSDLRGPSPRIDRSTGMILGGTGTSDPNDPSLPNHFRTCQKYPLRCPFYDMGCRKMIMRCQWDTHHSSNASHHANLVQRGNNRGVVGRRGGQQEQQHQEPGRRVVTFQVPEMVLEQLWGMSGTTGGRNGGGSMTPTTTVLPISTTSGTRNNPHSIDTSGSSQDDDTDEEEVSEFDNVSNVPSLSTSSPSTNRQRQRQRQQQRRRNPRGRRHQERQEHERREQQQQPIPLGIQVEGVELSLGVITRGVNRGKLYLGLNCSSSTTDDEENAPIGTFQSISLKALGTYVQSGQRRHVVGYFQRAQRRRDADGGGGDGGNRRRGWQLLLQSRTTRGGTTEGGGGGRRAANALRLEDVYGGPLARNREFKLVATFLHEVGRRDPSVTTSRPTSGFTSVFLGGRRLNHRGRNNNNTSTCRSDVGGGGGVTSGGGDILAGTFPSFMGSCFVLAGMLLLRNGVA